MEIVKWIINVIIFVVIGLLFADSGGVLSSIGNVFIILLWAVPISIILVLLKDYYIKNVQRGKNTKNEDINIEQMNILADEYINNVMKSSKTELDSDDYIKFYEIIKQNNIKLNATNTSIIPTDVRRVLYKAYLNKLDEFEKIINEKEEKNDKLDKELFHKFFNEINEYSINYIKTFLPKNIMPTDINLNIEEDQISAFIYILENNYQIKIPDLKTINYDTLYLSENTLQSLRNVLHKYILASAEERKKCLVDFILCYIYAIEVYKLFENKLINDEKIIGNIENIVKKYVQLFGNNFLYVDLLLEYINKNNISLPCFTEDYDFIENAEMLFENYIKPEVLSYDTFHINFNDYYDSNKQYFYLLDLITKEIQQTKIKQQAQFLIEKISGVENNKGKNANIQKDKRLNYDWWMSLSPWDFEKEIAEWFKEQGYNVKITKGSGDGGVDMFLTKDSSNTIVQCKQYNNPVPPEPIRALWGIKNDYGADNVVLIATNGITKGGKEFIQNKKEFIVYTLDDIINFQYTNLTIQNN